MNSKATDSLKLCFGLETQWEIPDSASIASHFGPQRCADLVSELQRALVDPIDFPSLDQAVVPGDQMVFAVDPHVPQLPEVVLETLAWFADRGTSPGNMRVVIAGNAPGTAHGLDTLLGERFGQGVAVELHDPDDMDKISYVAANENSDPIYLNRSLVDADVVIPISVARSPGSLDNLGSFGMFPLLSNRETLNEFYSLPNLDIPTARDNLIAWCDQAARWTGFMAGIDVLPASGQQIASLFAGSTASLYEASQRGMQDAWCPVATQSELTIALVDGDPSQQTWLAIARALYAANQFTTDAGAIVLCTESSDRAGKSLRRLRDSQHSREVLAEKLSKDRSSDAAVAALIHQATASKHIYLVSKHRRETIESIGLGVLANESELCHLIQQFDSCTVLGSAQHSGAQNH